MHGDAASKGKIRAQNKWNPEAAFSALGEAAPLEDEEAASRPTDKPSSDHLAGQNGG